MSSYSQLEASGLPFDWSVVLVGWQGIGGAKLSGREVIHAASDLIGKGPEKKDDLAALLLFVDPTDWEMIDRYLHELADAPVDTERALRVWRLVSLKDFLVKHLPFSDNLEFWEVEEVFWDLWYLHFEKDLAGTLPEGLLTQKSTGELIVWHLDLAQTEEAWVHENF